MKERQQSVSDLLALRDREPLDGSRAVAASGDPREIERLRRLRALKSDLQSLPALEPDPANLQRIRARLAAPQHRRPGNSGRMWNLLLASAAVLTFGVLVSLLVQDARWPEPSEGQIGSSHEMRSRPALTGRVAGMAGMNGPGPGAELNALRQVSFRLEGLARAVPGLPVSGSRAGDPAESALLYRLADLDGQLLERADAGRLDAETERTLWARRVELLGTLTRIRQINATRQVAYY